VRLLLALAYMHRLELRSIDFIPVFSQAILEIEVCVEISYSFDIFYDKESYMHRL